MASYPVPQDNAKLPDLIRLVRNLYRGKMNVTGTVTLTAADTATTIKHPVIGPTSFIGLSPLTATAAAAITVTFVASQGSGSAVLTHDSDAATDRIFAYAIIG